MRLAAVVLLAGCGRIAFDAADDAGDAPSDIDAAVDAIDPDAIIDIAAGGFITCVLRARGDVYCWGRADTGKLGDGTIVDRAEAGLVPAPVPFIAIDSSDGGTCGLVADGTAWCWGLNLRGQFGLNTNQPLLAPTKIPISGIAQLAIGLQGTCLRLTNGQVMCAGRGDVAGDGLGVDTQTFVTVAGVTDATYLAMGEEHACVLGASGAARCWGGNVLGQLGDGTMMTALTPVMVSTTSYDEVHMGDGHTCARRGGAIDCWGNNTDGQLGDATFMPRPSPSAVANVTDATSVSATAYTTCALRSNGTVVCWGNHEQGELGNGSTMDSSVPVDVPGLVDVVEVSARTGLHVCARTRDGQVYCWGDNEYGQCGDPALGTDVVTPRLVTLP